MTTMLKPQSGASAKRGSGSGAIRLRDMGSLHTPGRVVQLSGLDPREVLMAEGGQPVLINPNGQYVVEQMYAQYFLPEVPNGKPPLLFWHGGGMTGKVWETTPDGRPGWLNYFLQAGWDCYLCDAVERGRSGFAPVPEVWSEQPISQTAADVYSRFRIGVDPQSFNSDPALRRPYPNSQFPADAVDGLLRQMVPRWTQTDAAILYGYRQLLEQVGPAIVVAHSQAGVFGLRTAHAMHEQVRALVALEPASVPSLDESTQPYDTRTLFVMGDNIDTDKRWPQMKQRLQAFQSAHPSVDWLSLPDQGMSGNSHVMMMDLNSLEIAAKVNAWLEAV